MRKTDDHQKVILKDCRYCTKGKLTTGQKCPACNGTGKAKIVWQKKK